MAMTGDTKAIIGTILTTGNSWGAPSDTATT